ncbi:hypothetical protein BDZ91DRAFT_851779 [Kalaharituber pfeilii]|nr:hypothetical protein BDZ91DRAFT_851779 [Kalaharituber pfeilii]
MKLKELSQTEYLVLIWGLLLLSTLFSSIRFTVRWKTQSRFYVDDWWAVASWACLLTLAILYTSNANSMFFLSNYFKELIAGRQPIVNPDDIIRHNKIFGIVQLVAMLFFWTTLWAGKLSLLSFYRRLMEGVQGYMPWWWGVLIINVLTYWACFLSNFLTCLPLERRWSPDLMTNCSTPDAIKSTIVSIRFASGVDIATDLLIMMLPVPLLWGLRIPLAQKIGLAFIFCLGAIVIVFAIFRLKGVTDSISVVSHTAAQDLAMWSMVECSVAVVVISLPALRSLLSRRVSATRYGSKAASGALGGSGKTGPSGVITGSSHTGMKSGTHIRLHNIDKSKRWDSGDGLSSSSREELRRAPQRETINDEHGISFTREVFVSSTPGDEQFSQEGHGTLRGQPQGIAF